MSPSPTPDRALTLEKCREFKLYMFSYTFLVVPTVKRHRPTVLRTEQIDG